MSMNCSRFNEAACVSEDFLSGMSVSQGARSYRELIDEAQRYPASGQCFAEALAGAGWRRVRSHELRP